MLQVSWFGVRLAALVLILILTVSVSSAAKPMLESRWLDREVSLDGSVTEWDGAMAVFEDPALAVGVRNDGDYLYLCFHTFDPDVIRQAMSRGLIVRLGPKGGEPLALRYPVGLAGSGPPRRPGSGAPDREEMHRRLEETLGTFQILGSTAGEAQDVPVDNGLGIGVYIGLTSEALVYELKVPLETSDLHPYVVGGTAGGEILFTLEAGEFDREAMPMRRGGERGGMGRGGMGGGMGGGMRGGMGDGMGGPGGGMRGRPSEMGKSLKLKARVRLASPE